MREFLRVIRYPVVIELGSYLLMWLCFGVPYYLVDWHPSLGLAKTVFGVVPYLIVLAFASLLYGCQKFNFGFFRTLLVTSLFVFGHVYGFWIAFAASEGHLFEQGAEHVWRDLSYILWSNLLLCAGISVTVAGSYWLVRDIQRRKRVEAEKTAAEKNSRSD